MKSRFWNTILNYQINLFFSSFENFLLVPFKQDWDLICLWQLSTRENFLWHKGHWNGCSPVWERICDSIWCLFFSIFKQYGHANFREPVSDSIGIGSIWKNKIYESIIGIFPWNYISRNFLMLFYTRYLFFSYSLLLIDFSCSLMNAPVDQGIH